MLLKCNCKKLNKCIPQQLINHCTVLTRQVAAVCSARAARPREMTPGMCAPTAPRRTTGCPTIWPLELKTEAAA